MRLFLGCFALASPFTASSEDRKWAAVQSVGFVHSRLQPIARFIEIDIPECNDAASSGEALAKIAGYAASGVITADEAVSISRVIEIRLRAIELTDHEAPQGHRG
jgi:hypothetical protein